MQPKPNIALKLKEEREVVGEVGNKVGVGCGLWGSYPMVENQL